MRAVELLKEAGRSNEAIGVYQHTAEAGNPRALGRAVELLRAAGRSDEAIDWLQTYAAETGDPDALVQAAELLERAGRSDDAAKLRQYGLEPGSRIASKWY